MPRASRGPTDLQRFLTDPAVSIVTTGSNYPYLSGCEPNNYRHDSNGENYMHVYASGPERLPG